MTRSSSTTIFLSLLLIGALLIPTGLVQASNEPGQPEDLVVLVEPRHTTLQDEAALVQAVNNQYVFDFETFHADGSPFLFTEYIIDVHTIDAEGEMTDTLIFTETRSTAPTNEGTVRIPASQIAWGGAMPANGITFTVILRYDENGDSLVEESEDGDLHLPAGNYNAAVKEMVANGNYEEADQADEAFTPIFLLNSQPNGVIDAKNPLVNPGFEVGADEDTSNPSAWESATPPWALYAGDDDGFPVNSTTRQLSGQGVSGSAVRIDYDMGDQGDHVSLAQFLHAPGADVGHWVSTEDLRVEYDIRVTSGLSSFHGSANLHWLTETGSSSVNLGPSGGVPTDGQWHHVELDFSQAVPAGHELTFFTLSLYTQGYDSSASLVVDYDNVQIKGAEYVPNVNPRNDLTDGHAGFIQPLHASVTDTDEVIQGLATLGDGSTAYVYEISGIDHTDIEPQPVDMASPQDLVFQFLDERFIATEGSHADEDVVYSDRASPPTQSPNVFQHLGNDGSVADSLLVVVPADQVDATSVVPWFWANVATDDIYTDTFGQSAEPFSAFYSVAKNQMAGLSIADQLDYGFTPIQLSGEVAHSVGTSTELIFFCDATGSGSVCDVPDSGQVDFTVTVDNQGTDVLETLEVSLVDEDGNVLDATSVDVPGRTTTTLSIPDATGMHDEQVRVQLGAGAFAEGGQSQPIRLVENFDPNQRPTVEVSTETLVAEPGDLITVTAEAFDVEGDPITFSSTLSTEVPGDTFTDNQDGTATWTWEIPLSQKTGTTVTFEASDGDLVGTNSTTIELEIPAKAAVLDPLNETGVATTTVLEDTDVTLRASAQDLSGTLDFVKIYPEGFSGTAVNVTSQGGPDYTLAYNYAEPGAYDVGVQVKNSDGIWVNESRTIQVAANQAPVVDAGEDIALDATDPSPTTIDLVGDVSDPENRGIDTASLTWTDGSGNVLASGTETTSVDLGPGSYTFTLEATDVDGLTASDSVTVVIDDSIQAEGKLLNVGQPNQDGVYVIDGPTDMILSALRGQVDVTDDLGEAVGGAAVVGTVLYHGPGDSELGIETGTFEATTRQSGTADFSVSHDVLGLTSAPGLHEIQVTVTQDSRDTAPVDDIETDTFSIFYWIGPQV